MKKILASYHICLSVIQKKNLMRFLNIVRYIWDLFRLIRRDRCLVDPIATQLTAGILDEDFIFGVSRVISRQLSGSTVQFGKAD